MKLRVNINSAVDSKKIRRELRNGREHIVIPSYTLPFNVVMNGGLYTEEGIKEHYPSLEGTLAPLGHPQMDGVDISAFEPEAINANYVGAWNRAVSLEGNRVYAEKWVDVEVASRTENGKRLLERLERLESGEDTDPIHTSAAVFLEKLDPTEEQKATGAEWVAKIYGIDHDAILLDEQGAATPYKGVGLFVNVSDAQSVLTGLTAQQKHAELASLLEKRFNATTDRSVWVADFTDREVVFVVEDTHYMVPYTQDESGKLALLESTDPVPVERPTGWVKIASNKLRDLFKKPGAVKPTPNKEDDIMPLSKEDQEALAIAISESVTSAVAAGLAPIQDRMAALETNQQALSDSLTAAQRAEEQAQREAVAAVLGELAANSLSGESLKTAYENLQSGKRLAPNHASAPAKEQDFSVAPE